jgi:hypothetical protein
MYCSLSQTNRLSHKAKSDDLEIHGSSTCRFDNVDGFWFLFDTLRSLRRRSHCDVAVRVEFLTPDYTWTNYTWPVTPRLRLQVRRHSG